MRILITNDDGIFAEGLKILVSKAKKYGEVTVCAPKVEQSAKSHGINVHNPFKCEKIKLYDDVDCYMCDSTPADCVRFAYYQLKVPYDIVFSGVNKGYNLGEDIMYSGTVSAIFEAVSTHSKGIAFSVCKDSFNGAEKYFDEIMDYVINNDLLKENDIYNINIPETSKGIKITKQGSCNFDTYFEKVDDNLFMQQGDPIFETNKDLLMLDTACVMNDYISITPLTIDRTNLEVYKRLSNKK